MNQKNYLFKITLIKQTIMKKILTIFLAVLVLGACGTATMDAKKRTNRKAKTKTTAVSASKIEKDVSDFCAAIYQLANDDIPFGSSICFRFFEEGQLSKRIDKYRKQGKLTQEQKDRIDRAIKYWEDSYEP